MPSPRKGPRSGSSGSLSWPTIMQLTMGPGMTLIIAVVLLIALWRHPPESESGVSFKDTAMNRKEAADENAQASPGTIYSVAHIGESRVIPSHSLTVILPVTEASFPSMEKKLRYFLTGRTRLQDIWLVCPETLVTQAKPILRRLVASLDGHDYPVISLHPPFSSYIENLAVDSIRMAGQVKTDWVLILDEQGLDGFSEYAKDQLLNPLDVPLPVGPRGVVDHPHRTHCIPPSPQPLYASYLAPPFVTPSSLAHSMSSLSHSAVWKDFGRSVSAVDAHAHGGIVVNAEEDWCREQDFRKRTFNDTLAQLPLDPLLPPDGNSICPMGETGSEIDAEGRLAQSIDHPSAGPSGQMYLVLPSVEDLRELAPVACSFLKQGYQMKIILYGLDTHSGGDFFERDACILPYTRSSFSALPEALLDDRELAPFATEVVITTDVRPSDALFLKATIQRQFPLATHIQLPREDLIYTSWIASLSFLELKNWHRPQVDVSVITKDRPKSLLRLITSLANARFFGDTLSLRFNIDQSLDYETQHLVDHYTWPHGPVFVHHRVKSGGLLPSVVESWYPSSNDSYGLLLEDDVELSPLFYAWVKMTVLRYRYGDKRNRSPQLFGISLYQPKNIELRPQGRQPFDARKFFSRYGHPHPSIPYLSQIPCSWGALYFPEHWREFHSYLSARLAEVYINLERNIVPNVRSNRWKKSWKKFFIELVYLRGYVMLYPNFEDFLSLSTNHVEVGSHVKARTREKLELFLLPLMPLSAGRPNGELLKLPGKTLPAWSTLPVLNLTGAITTLDDILEDGLERRNEITVCPLPPTTPYDARDLMCDAYIIPSWRLGSVISL
ncbi:Glycosyltransferase 2 [Pleurotus pulmonarius]